MIHELLLSLAPASWLLFKILGGNWELVTVIECVAADGTALPLFVVWKGALHLRWTYAHLLSGDEAEFAISEQITES